MAIETDVSDLREQRKRKARRSFLIRLAIVAAAAGLVIAAVLTKNKWYPYLDGILSKIPVFRSDSDSGIHGNFPIVSAGGTELVFSKMDGGFALVDDSKFYIYDCDGKCVAEKQHMFTNPVINTSGKKALIYDLGGNAFTLESKYKTIYTKTTENPILMAALSSNDIAAVVTKSDKFLAQLDIYNTDGICIFTYKSSDSRIIGVTFCSDGCIVTTLGAGGGQIYSGLIRLGFNSGEPVWKSQNANTLAVSTSVDEEGNIVVCGDDRCDYFDVAGTLIAEHQYGDKLTDHSESSKLTAVLLENTALRKNRLLIIRADNCKYNTTVDLPDDARRVIADGEIIYVLTGKGIYTYNSGGQYISDVQLTDSFENFSKIDNYVFLCNYDRVYRINFAG